LDFELLRGTASRLHLIDCRVEGRHLLCGAAYLPSWLKEKEPITDGDTTLTVEIPPELSGQSAPASCVDLRLELH